MRWACSSTVFLRPAGIAEWPDGTVAARYGFLHALYQQLWHERVSIGKVQRWHRRIGKRQEAAYGERAGEIAAELAVHFEEGRDLKRALRYRQQAAQNALRRSATQEAIIHLTKGLTQMYRGLTAYRTGGAEVGWPYLLALLAETCKQGGQVDEGLRLVAEALTTLEKNTDRCYEPELYRIKGELTLAQSRVQRPASSVHNPRSAIRNPQSEAEAEAYFRQAILIARERQAKMFELRAGMSLSRLWQQQGKKAEARQMLAEIYGWFTEGFATTDLKEAKALLDSLGSSV